MNRSLYTISLYILSPLVWLYFFYRGFKDPDYLKGLRQRLGFASLQNAGSSIHIHCASVGETRAAIPLLNRLAKEYPLNNILITTTTPTGRVEVLKLIKKLQTDNIRQHGIQHCYLPIDWPGACYRFVKWSNPKISILMETELWPNLLHQLSKRNIPVLLANARLSDSSLKKYQKHLSLSKELFAKITRVAAQYQSDSLNFQSLGVANDAIELTGSIKFDIRLSDDLKTKQYQLKQQWSKHRPSWVAASIHPAEFEMILNVHQKLLTHFPDLLLIAVPRHPERFEELKQVCDKLAIDYISRSDHRLPEKKHSVIVGDSMGELTLMFGAANIAYVGGSLIERGGHNPLEPAACGLPVIMGPSDYNFSDVSQILQKNDVLEKVTDASGLYNAMERLLSQPALIEARSQATKHIFNNNRGAIDKIMALVRQLMHLKGF